MNKMQIRNQWATLPLSTNKRHLVFGDIHGRFTTFINLLDKVNYDPSSDMLYSVGDLIDRGPDSVSVVEFFMQDNCYAVRGNHEQMIVNLPEWHQVWMHPPNGGPNTLASMDQHGKDFAWLQDYCTSTPILLDVGDTDNEYAFRIVHAENPFIWSEQRLVEFLSNLSSVEMGESELLWGRDNISLLLNNIHSMKPGTYGIQVDPDRSKRSTFCGHTPTRNIIRGHNTTWIDTYLGRKMSCVDVITNKVHDVPMANGE